MKTLPIAAALLVLAAPVVAAELPVGPPVDPNDPLGVFMQQEDQRLRRENERAFEALRENDSRRRMLADTAADTQATGIVAEGRARLHDLDEAEIERLRAQIRAERLAREAEIRRRDRMGR